MDIARQIMKKIQNQSPPSGSTPNILVDSAPLSFMPAATPESRPPPPQQTITTSGLGISSNISTPTLRSLTRKIQSLPNSNVLYIE